MKATTLPPATPELMKALEQDLENELSQAFKKKSCVTLEYSLWEIERSILNNRFFKKHVFETLQHLGYVPDRSGLYIFNICDLENE